MYTNVKSHHFSELKTIYYADMLYCINNFCILLINIPYTLPTTLEVPRTASMYAFSARWAQFDAKILRNYTNFIYPCLGRSDAAKSCAALRETINQVQGMVLYWIKLLYHI
jgi:hypothetical protein